MVERDIANWCDDYARLAGCQVQSFEQFRPSKVSPALVDRRYWHRARQIRLWLEFKKPGAQLSRDQYEFLLSEIACNSYATVIDDVHQLEKLWALCASPRVGRDQLVLQYCKQLVDITALRGFRGEPLPDSARKRPRKTTR